ncbi:MAG TPA: septal ring lytic transglycosylase RlpA family protein, partial [Longimicrobiales bacterium]|nr:septal ring lytic transglycosylase RlpA family protein [Longimicrobiales bacterium]
AAAPAPVREPALATITGSASYYADRFEGRTTASGVPFRQARMWAAHRTLPFGTRLRVTNLANGNEVEVEVVDRGPYAHGRVLDLSRTAARELDFIRAGHTRVRIEVLERP